MDLSGTILASMSPSGGLRAVLSRIFRVLFWPVAVALDPRLKTLEHRLTLRMDRLENHVATDAEVAAELAVTQSRTLGRLEERLRLAESAAQRGAVHNIEAAWALAAVGGIASPGRIVVDHGDQGPVALALAALGHEVFASAAEDPTGPFHERLHLLASLDEALAAAGPVDAVVVLSPQAGAATPIAAVAPRIATALRDGGVLLAALPDGVALPAGWRIEHSALITLRAGTPEWVVDASADERPGTRLVRALAAR